MATKKTAPQPNRKLREGGFTFHVYAKETLVFRGRRELGAIIGMKEKSGRHCFRLAVDGRNKPRTYRGRVQAAEALSAIDQIVRDAKKHHWSPQELVIRAWADKPRASQQTTD